MTSIKGIQVRDNSLEGIEDRQIKRKIDTIKQEADRQSNIFLEKFKKGAKVETVQYPKSGGLFSAEQPKIEKIYDKDGNFLYTKKTYQDGFETYEYTDKGRKVEFQDFDGDGNMDVLGLTNPDGTGYFTSSRDDDGIFDQYYW